MQRGGQRNPQSTPPTTHANNMLLRISFLDTQLSLAPPMSVRKSVGDTFEFYQRFWLRYVKS